MDMVFLNNFTIVGIRFRNKVTKGKQRPARTTSATTTTTTTNASSAEGLVSRVWDLGLGFSSLSAQVNPSDSRVRPSSNIHRIHRSFSCQGHETTSECLQSNRVKSELRPVKTWQQRETACLHGR